MRRLHGYDTSMPENTVERRITALEREVESLKERVGNRECPGNWIDHVSGSMADMPEFAEVVELGRQMRKADRPADLYRPMKRSV